MKITEYLTSEMIAVNLSASGKEEALELMVGHVVEHGGLDVKRKRALIEKLMEREDLGSTGVGGGVAIPHASGENLEKMIVAIGVFPDGVEYDAIDAKPVNLIFMIVGPEREPRAHLQLLAAIVRTIRNKKLVQGVLESNKPEQAYEVIAGLEKH